MSNCRGQDPMFPPAGIPQFKPAHDFPTRFTNFHWWGEVEVDTDVCFRSIRRDELPIPPLHEERWRYPYRYSSAQPCGGMGCAWLDKQKEKEQEKTLQPIPKKKLLQSVDPRLVRQSKGYETTSMDASLQPFLYTTPNTIIRSETPPHLLTRTWAPKCSHTEFGEFVLRSLHPNYRNDPRVKKRVQFNSRDSSRDLCVSLDELEHLTQKPQKTIKKKDFLISQLGTGHQNAILEDTAE